MESPVAVGQVLVGKYRVEQVLGSGGMGVVVAAWHQELEQRVAVKFLHPMATERADALERFRREARAAAKIRSEHVARVLDIGTLDGGYPYMVMEYLEGQDLASELRTRGTLPISDTAEYLLQAIEALAEAHSVGIVHRDLKPANLYVSRRRDGTHCIKVLDFGISKALLGGSIDELALTKTASLIGSPLYMAPEQMRSAKDVDTRADIWSIGAILYEVLTGRPPYTGESIPQLCASLMNDTPVPMRELRQEIPERLERAVMRCLEKERERRFPTVSELGQALVEFAPAGRLHADRASRVLGAKDVTLSADHSDPALSIPQGAPTERMPFEQTPSVGTPSAVLPHPTVNSWAGTGAAAKSSSRRGAWIATAVVLGIIAAIAVVLLRDREASSAATVASPAEAPTSGSTAPEPEATAAREPSVVPDAVPIATSSNSPQAAASVSAVPPPPKKPGLAAKPSSKPPASKPVADKPAGPGQISDFGGRR